MKILAITDIHGAYSVAEKIIAHEQPDTVIIGGDLTNAGTVNDVKHAVQQFHQHCSTLLCIAGNMDLPIHDDWYAEAGISLNATGVIVDDIGLFGVSGGPISPLHTPYEISEEEIHRRCEQGFKVVAKCRRKIFIPHAPPYGTKLDIIHAGYHVGSVAVRECIEAEQPNIVVCGHIHEARGQDSIDKTRIVNCGYGLQGYYVIINVHNDIHIMNKQFPL